MQYLSFISRRGRIAFLTMLVVAAVGALVALGYFGYARWRAGSEVREEPEDLSAIYYSSPYQNTRPGVAYVGDQKCAECHAQIADTYKKHPMGQSMFAAADFPSLEGYDKTANNPFQNIGFEFAIEKKPGKLAYKATKHDEQGKTVIEDKQDIHYIMGSGTRGRSYLRSKDGFVFQTPVSWYAQKNGWDLSPGFEAIYPPDRAVETACLFCHANKVEPVLNSLNHFQEPVFRGLAIGCERCHGPGELHVQARMSGEPLTDKSDYTIVNPADLSPLLREAVCQQCHLQAEKRFERRNRQFFDYRPGLPLHEFLSVWVKSPALGGNQKAVGHFEQMFDSVCYKSSSGKMGCITCHNPHSAPKPEEKVSFFRSQCLKCHQDKGCSVPTAERLKQRADDSCSACHMPRFQSSDVVHTAVTDHRVLRKPSKDDNSSKPRPKLKPGESPLVNFFEKELSPQDPDLARDKGLALWNFGKLSGPMLDHVLPIAVPLLEEALQRRPRDAVVWEAKGWALSTMGLGHEALKAFDKALELVPDREMSLRLASAQAEQLNQHESAIAYLRRLIAVNPGISDYHLSLAKQLAATQNWQGALTESETAMNLNRFSSDGLKLLVTSCLRLGEDQKARREFDKLMALKPNEHLALRLWFKKMKSE